MNKINEEDDAQMKADFLAAMWGVADGNAAEACRITGVHYRRQYKWMREDASFKTEIELVREKYVDKLEKKMKALTECGDLNVEYRATRFELEKRARHRGYGTDSTVTVNANVTGPRLTEAEALSVLAQHGIKPAVSQLDDCPEVDEDEEA